MASLKIAKGVLLLVAVTTVVVTGYKLFVKQNTLPSPCKVTFPIRKGAGFNGGCENEHVRNIQKWINVNIKVPYRPLVADGKFGSETELTLNAITGKKEVSESDYKKML